MHRWYRLGLPLLILICVISANTNAGDFEVGRRVVYDDNLLLDSNRIVDFYIADNASFTLYPTSFFELGLTAEHTHYRDIQDLDNFKGGFSLTALPLSSESPYSIYLAFNFNGLLYGDDFDDFENNMINSRASFGYWARDDIQLRTGYSYDATKYVANDENDKESHEIFAGVNFSFLGSNALDIEVGYALANYRFIGPENKYIDPYLAYVTFTEDQIREWHISPRYSRPLGSKMGVGITFLYKEFLDTEDAVVLGSTFENLSPWSTVWQGKSLTVNLKSFHIPHAVISVGAGYWNKRYIRTLEQNVPQLSMVDERQDEQSKYYISFQRPIMATSGLFGEPGIRIEYTNNSSSHVLYDYHDLDVTFSIRFRF